MPTLLERSQDVRDVAKRLGAATSEKDRFKRLTTRAVQLRDARDRLDKARTAARLLAGKGLFPAVPQPSAALSGKAPALRAVLAGDWRAFADDQTISNTLVGPVEQHATKVHGAALETWRTHVEVGLPAIRDALVATLAKAGFQNQCDRLRQLRAEVDALKRATPTATADFERLHALKADVQAIWATLQGVPDDVQTFLAKASERKAVIADLTPGIRAWLSDHGMLDQLRIGLG